MELFWVFLTLVWGSLSVWKETNHVLIALGGAMIGADIAVIRMAFHAVYGW